MADKNIQDIRQSYLKGELLREHLHEDPKEMTRSWLNQAIEAEVLEPTAVTLSTVDLEGNPSSRTVLIKEIDEGFVFYTNYSSTKGDEIAANHNVALLFFWKELERQIRIKGEVEKISEEQSMAYFRKRPKGSQLGAWASPQSQAISGRNTLEDRLAELSDIYATRDVLPKPAHWGGYRGLATSYELWQGRDNRLHDRFAFTREDYQWHITRLAP